ncbi:MAG: ParB/RepB/Spo0J family partition protein [Clostridia bacterium]|nr:ParB/RepB/Spo0J family partition protein [Clostridia bacterium]
MSVLYEGQSNACRQACALPIDRIYPNPRQPRKGFDELKLMELASSIRQHGLLQPITVRAAGGGYEIVMGERRYRACMLLGFSQIDAFILSASEGESGLLALIENLQREDLHYFEEAEAYASILSQGVTQEALARRLGKSASGIANKLRLMKLSPELRQFLREEGLSERHARALLPLTDAAARLRIARQAAQQHLTVRETEALVLKAQQRLPTSPPKRKVISLVRDSRLYINAIKSICKQMQDTGLDARVDTDDNELWTEIRIRIQKTFR